MKEVIVISDSRASGKTEFQEMQLKKFREMHERNTKRAHDRLKEQYRLEKVSEILNFDRDQFSLKKFREAAYAMCIRTREAASELALGQLLRSGVQNLFDGQYLATPTTYEAVVRVAQSDKRQEYYAPLERVGYPKRVGRQEGFPSRKFVGIDKEIINYKTGMMFEIERELLDDDQTGQVVSEAKQLGENARVYEDAYVWNRITNGTNSFDGEKFAASQTYGTVYSTTGIYAAAGLFPASGINATGNGRVSQSQIQAGYILAQQMTDQQGNPMVVDPDTIAVSKQDIFYIKTLLESDFNPSMSSTATADIGKVGGIGAKNPIKGLLTPISTRFLPNYAAIMMQAGKGFVFQRRDATEVIQENPMSGPAFTQDVFRYKERSRWEADWIDPRYAININPSLAST